jgi:hypothetical protein
VGNSGVGSTLTAPSGTSACSGGGVARSELEGARRGMDRIAAMEGRGTGWSTVLDREAARREIDAVRDRDDGGSECTT